MAIDRKSAALLEDLTHNLYCLKKSNPCPRAPIVDIVQDSRKVKPGSLFIAIPGHYEDGHKYIEEAVKRGAVAIVSERDCSLWSAPFFQVPNSRRALSYLAGVFYQHPSRDLFLLGITGTNGKTTTAFMAYSIFKEAGTPTGLLGTVMVDDGKVIKKADLTTPDSLDLQKILFKMKKNQVQAAIMEVSSQGLEQHRVVGMDFNRGIFTNLTAEHLEYHGGFAAYQKAKAKFLDCFSADREILYNKDDKRVHQLFSERRALSPSFSLRGKGDFNGEILSISKEGIRCRFSFLQGEKIDLKLRLLGRHNIYNALSAAAASYLENISLEAIKRALESFQPVPRRLEIHKEDDLLIIDDTALNPASYQVVFETIEDLCYRDLIIVNAIRGERGPEINRANAKVLAQYCQRLHPKQLIITSSKGRTSSLDDVRKDEKNAFLGELYSWPYLFFPCLDKAIEEAMAHAKKGDLLLLLGAQGMDQGFSIIKEKKFQPQEGNKIHIKNK